MTELYLVTGFLGAGKTTFLKKFIKIFKNRTMHVIVNEFGKEGIDGQLLKEVGTVLEEINNGSIFCSCRLDMFETALEKVLQKEPELIIIEASGLSNPTNIRKILNQPEKFSQVKYMGSICLVDAMRFLKVYQTATVVKKQISISDLVLINKTDLADEKKIQEVERVILEHRPDMTIYRTSYGEIQPEWLSSMEKPHEEAEQARLQSKDITLRNYLLEIEEDFTAYDFQKFVEMFLEDTYRVKGFVKLQGMIYLLDCVGPMFSMEPYEEEVKGLNRVVILAGNGLPVKKSVETAMKWYPGKIKKFERG